MADVIRLVLSNLPIVLFVAAIAIAVLTRGEPFTSRLLSWLLLLSVGVDMVWAGLFHIFAPETAASSIGWQVSPFQFEIGVADTAAGIVAILSFWRGYQFKAAIALYTVLFYIGVAIGHFRDAYEHANYAANNFGLLLVLTLTKIVLLSALLVMTRSDARR